MARFVARCAMRWADMDAFGHINNTAYLSYLEQARVMMFFDRYDASFSGGTVVAHHEITYLKPVIYHPEPLRVEMWVENVRGASFRVQYEVFDGQVLAAHASTAIVTFDFTSNKPRRLTSEEREILRSYTIEAGPADEQPPTAPGRNGAGPDGTGGDAAGRRDGAGRNAAVRDGAGPYGADGHVTTSLTPTRDELADFEPLAQRARSADPLAFIRIRTDGTRIAGFVTLPYDVIAGRTIAGVEDRPADLDVTYATSDFIEWMAGADEPTRKDPHWLSLLPPRSGWQRIEKVPDSAIRDVVRSGALLARDITARDEQQSLLASTVLTATSAATPTAASQSHQVPLRALTALTKMGFLPRNSVAAVDLAPGWLRLAATYGSTYVATGSGLFGLLGP